MVAIRKVAPQSGALPTPGSVFAGHVIEGLIGCGGMGVVYRARHCRLNRVVALKVIAPELLDDASVRRRFLDEAVTAASLEHPHVVPVYDAGECEGVAYIVMRYVQGLDLSGLVRDVGPLPPARAAEIVAKVGEALDTMHRAGYVHRDVKPRNLLIARGGQVYLGDFGLARPMEGGTGATRVGHWVGTVDYVAPEQVRGGRVDARADVYGLGGVLYFALTGRPPYERDTDEAKLWAHLCERPPSPSRAQPGVPPAMDTVVARALAKEPARRFPSGAELGRSALACARGTSARTCERSGTRAGLRPAAEATTVSRKGTGPAMCEPRGSHRRPAPRTRSWTRW